MHAINCTCHRRWQNTDGKHFSYDVSERALNLAETANLWSDKSNLFNRNIIVLGVIVRNQKGYVFQ